MRDRYAESKRVALNPARHNGSHIFDNMTARRVPGMPMTVTVDVAGSHAYARLLAGTYSHLNYSCTYLMWHKSVLFMIVYILHMREHCMREEFEILPRLHRMRGAHHSQLASSAVARKSGNQI